MRFEIVPDGRWRLLLIASSDATKGMEDGDYC